MIKAHLAGLGFASIFGLSFIFSKLALAELTPFGLLSIRFCLAWGVMQVLVSLKFVTIEFSQKSFLIALPVVIAQPLVYFTFEIIGLSMVPSSLAGVMIAMIPLITLAIASKLTKHKISLIQLGWMVLSFLGVLWLTQLNTSSQNQSASILGIVLIFLAVLSAASFNVLSKHATQSVSAMTLTYMMMLVGAIGFSVAHGVEVMFLDIPWSFSLWFNSPQLGLPLLYLGIVASIGGFFLVNYALSILSSASASVYANLATVVSILVGVIFLQESFSSWHALASLMVILGVKMSVSMKS
ncbi:MAG: DMT family transporter [Erysipelotrichia bacterium]|jgi:drug/metabolite transporter (DMT)-like permease|nr:DMT family transporter [Erysipelotrichia bacterium]